MTDELKVPKRRAKVEVLLAGGLARQVTLFLAEFASVHAGPERVSDLLNEAGEFLPAVDLATDAMTFLNRTAIALARVSREWEEDDDSAGGDEQEVEIILSGGSALRGTLRFLQPPGRARLQDYLNDAPPFLRLAQDTEVVLVNKQHVARVSKVK